MLRFYLDENMSPIIAVQLRKRNIEVFTTQELNVLGDDDLTHLQRATAMGCVLCTQDMGFLRLAGQGISHTGIIFGSLQQSSIGKWVTDLEIIHASHTEEEMQNHIIYL